MAASSEMMRLVREHEAIRAYMRFLGESLSGLSERPIQVKERIWAYRWGLYDFRDAIQYHIELDERILGMLPGGAPATEEIGEHKEIRRQVDDVIRLVDNAVESELAHEELTRYARDIGAAFNRIRELIGSHTAKEDKLLGPWLKDV